MAAKAKWQEIDREILSRLDVVAEYRSLGVDVMADEPNADGWIPCRAFGREDNTPSAAVNIRTGRYKDHGGDGVNLSLYDTRAHLNGCADWQEARAYYAAKVGVSLGQAKGKGHKPAPDDHLEFLEPGSLLESFWALYWCDKKAGVTVDAMKAFGARWARYRDQFEVFAFPVVDQIQGDQQPSVKPIGYVLFNHNALSLPVYRKGREPDLVKMLTTAGSKAGLLGEVNHMQTAEVIFKTEGPTDALALCAKLLTMPADERQRYAVVCNSGGATERPRPEIVKLFAGKKVIVIGDADEPGQTGAKRWAEGLATEAAEVRNVRLPYSIQPNHGKDLRDWLNEGHTAAEFRELINQAEPVKATHSLESLSNFRTEEDGEQSVTVPLPMNQVLADILQRTDNWPRRVGPALFVHDPQRGVCWINTPAGLFGYLAGRCGIIEWARATGTVTKEEVFHELRRQADKYAAIEDMPHEPAIDNHYYACEFPPPGDGKTLEGLLDFFCLETGEDRQILKAAFATPMWGGPPGCRPAFMITATKGRGKGKSKLAQMLSRVFGGAVDVNAKDDMGDIKTRLLSAETATKRVILLDNVKTTRFSWGELEALITSDTISGRALYTGEGRRPNYLTWIITLNGASLSTDMAQRVVEIRLSEPEYSDKWEGEVQAYIATNRQALLGDLITFLRQSQKPMKHHSRWAMWESSLLSRLPFPDACFDLIVSRRSQVDVEEEEGGIIEDFFAAKLRWLNYDPERDDVFIANQTAAGWYNRATGEACKVTGVTRALKQLRNEGRLWRIMPARCGSSGNRGFRWVGEHADSTAPTKYDLGKRLAQKTGQEQKNPSEADEEESAGDSEGTF